MIHFDMPPMKSNIIKVLGFGGGGSNAVNHMYKQKISNVDFIICNTDAQSLATSEVPIKIQLGPHLTQGLGAGANPEVGKQATEESLEEIRRMLEINTKMAFITAGMGGGTGTGGAPAIAKVCREMGILTVGIVTTPFGFEGPKRMKHAQDGIEELKKHVDTLLVINNDKLRQQYGNLKMKEAFSKADDVLATAARCITDIINSTGQMNVDFADVCTVMKDGGVAILGNAIAKGEGRALRAIEEAINSPLLNDNDIRGAKWILINITSAEGDHEYTMDEVDAIQEYVRNLAGADSDVILGMGYDTNLTEELGITIIATGFGHKDPFMPPPPPKKEVVVVKKEIIGVLFEDAPAKNEVQPEMVSLPIENANPLAPVLLENVPAPNFVEPLQQTEDVEPVFMMLADAKTDNAPVVTEAIIEEPVAEFVPAELNFVVTEEPIVNGESVREELAATITSFLIKPSQIYAAPPVVNEIEQKQEEVSMLVPEVTVQPSQEIILEIREIQKEEIKEVKETRKTLFGDEESYDMGMVIKEDSESIKMEVKPAAAAPVSYQQDMSEEEEQKRRAQERVEKIKKLRNLSFNFNAADPNNEFEQVPAYMRREMDLHNSIANVENFYSRATVKTDENGLGSIGSLNTFLEGNDPD